MGILSKNYSFSDIWAVKVPIPGKTGAKLTSCCMIKPDDNLLLLNNPIQYEAKCLHCSLRHWCEHISKFLQECAR